MKSQYDYVFVTHLPAFYKVNLYAQIAKQCRVLVIFIGKGSLIRAQDFSSELTSDHIILFDGPFEKRNKLKSIFQLLTLLRKIKFRWLVLGGWDLLEFWILSLCFSSRNNALALESSIHDSLHTGWVWQVKRLFLSRIQTVFASGEPHRALLDALHYPRKVITTLGVGIFHYAEKTRVKSVFKGRFLYVGRLSSEKNIERLLAVFRQNPQYSLTIVGQGPLFEKLKTDCPSNVILAGYVENQALGKYYLEHDIFILPSLKEPWGLVVEEALYYGLPVIASHRVGCASDWIEDFQVGTTFDPLNNHSIEEAILWAESHYEVCLNNIRKIDFSARDKTQVNRYLEALS